jgi:hypothetical protein
MRIFDTLSSDFTLISPNLPMCKVPYKPCKCNFPAEHFSLCCQFVFFIPNFGTPTQFVLFLLCLA